MFMQLKETGTIAKSIAETPITSELDTQVIQRIINLKTFSIIPIFDKTNQYITHVYTVGMWYYWGIPEILIKFESNLYKNIGFIQTLINILHDLIFSKLKTHIISNETIEWIDFKTRHHKLNINLNNFNSSDTMTLNLVNESEYMEITIAMLMWFYMYFVDALKDVDGEPRLFPLYKLNLTTDVYENISNDVTQAITDKLIEQTNQNDFSDESITDDDDTNKMTEYVEDCDNN